METYTWYSQLIKPDFAPPAWVFGPVWTVLYILIVISFGFVLWQCIHKKLSWNVFLPFGLNVLFNLLFTPLQFGLQNLWLASLDILLVVGTLLWAMKSVYTHHKWVTYIQFPYLAWGLFATVLQLTITFLN